MCNIYLHKETRNLKCLNNVKLGQGQLRPRSMISEKICLDMYVAVKNEWPWMKVQSFGAYIKPLFH